MSPSGEPRKTRGGVNGVTARRAEAESRGGVSDVKRRMRSEADHLHSTTSTPQNPEGVGGAPTTVCDQVRRGARRRQMSRTSGALGPLKKQPSRRARLRLDWGAPTKMCTQPH